MNAALEKPLSASRFIVMEVETDFSVAVFTPLVIWLWVWHSLRSAAEELNLTFDLWCPSKMGKVVEVTFHRLLKASGL